MRKFSVDNRVDPPAVVALRAMAAPRRRAPPSQFADSRHLVSRRHVQPITSRPVQGARRATPSPAALLETPHMDRFRLLAKLCQAGLATRWLPAEGFNLLHDVVRPR
jgi:predicted nucleic acid-binding Zn ribbon protein